MNRKERREALVPTRIHTKFLYKEHDKLPVEIKEESDGRTIAIIQLEGYASTKVRDGSGDVVTPTGIDLSRFENGNAPLKAMHGRGVLSNVGVIKQARKDMDGLYIQAEARLNVSKDNNGRPINTHDYDLYDRLMNRTVNGFSIGFHNIVERYDRELSANIIESMMLHEISIVDVPDNPLTIIKMLEILHENEDGVLNSNTNMSKEIETHENEETVVEETTEEVEEKAVDEVEENSNEESQESKDSGNATTEESENDEDGDEGAEKSLETKSKEFEEQTKMVDSLTKELDETKKELESTKGMLQEAQDIAQGVIAKYKALEEENQELSNEVKELKKAKQEHGMVLTSVEGGEKEKGNVKKALQDGFKQLT